MSEEESRECSVMADISVRRRQKAGGWFSASESRRRAWTSLR